MSSLSINTLSNLPRQAKNEVIPKRNPSCSLIKTLAGIAIVVSIAMSRSVAFAQHVAQQGSQVQNFTFKFGASSQNQSSMISIENFNEPTTFQATHGDYYNQIALAKAHDSRIVKEITDSLLTGSIQYFEQRGIRVSDAAKEQIRTNVGGKINQALGDEFAKILVSDFYSTAELSYEELQEVAKDPLHGSSKAHDKLLQHEKRQLRFVKEQLVDTLSEKGKEIHGDDSIIREIFDIIKLDNAVHKLTLRLSPSNNSTQISI